MFRDKRRMAAMLAADRPGTPRDASPEVAAFRDLRAQIRAAEAAAAPTPPPFDLMWSGVEARLAANARDRAEAGERRAATGWRGWAGFRPLWVLAPAGALVMAAVLGYFVTTASTAQVDNRCYVDSYDATSGTILVEQDLDDRAGVTVIWHLDEG